MTSTPRRGPFAWLRALFGSRPAPLPLAEPPEIPEIETVHRSSVVSFETPARGGGFAFQVEIRCDWCAEGRLDRMALGRTISGCEAGMPERLAERIRDVARRYEPFRAEEAERAVNEELSAGECFDGGLVTCRTTAFLQPAPEVLEQQRAAALELQEIEHRYAKSALQVRLLSEVSEQWRTFLADGLAGVRAGDETASWLTPWAVLLAEQPDQAATEVPGMFLRREEQFNQFVKLLGGQKKAYDAHDLFDFVAKSEQQLGHAMRLFGLTAPNAIGAGDGPAEPLPRPQQNRG
jgi:hypothetical protein